MKTLIIPFVYKNNRRLVFNEGDYTNLLTDFRNEVKAIYNSIENIQVSFDKVFNDVLQSNVSKEHYLATVNNTLKLMFVNVNTILPNQTIESTAKSILKNE